MGLQVTSSSDLSLSGFVPAQQQTTLQSTSLIAATDALLNTPAVYAPSDHAALAFISTPSTTSPSFVFRAFAFGLVSKRRLLPRSHPPQPDKTLKFDS